jgi:hypothetical protein
MRISGETKGRLRLGLAVALLLGGADLAAAMKVKAEKDPKADLARYQTYRWRAPGSPGSGSPAADPSVDQKIRATADAELAKKGLRQLPEGEEPHDLWLSYSVAWSANFVNEGVVYDVGDWVAVGTDEYRSLDQAMLVLELVDASTDKAVWLGWATQKATTPQGQEALRRVADDAVIKILKKYPSR